MLSIRFTPERTAIRPSPYRNHRFISIRRPGVSVKSIYYFKSKYSNKIIIPIIFDNFFAAGTALLPDFAGKRQMHFIGLQEDSIHPGDLRRDSRRIGLS